MLHRNGDLWLVLSRNNEQVWSNMLNNTCYLTAHATDISHICSTEIKYKIPSTNSKCVLCRPNNAHVTCDHTDSLAESLLDTDQTTNQIHSPSRPTHPRRTTASAAHPSCQRSPAFALRSRPATCASSCLPPEARTPPGSARRGSVSVQRQGSEKKKKVRKHYYIYMYT